MQNLPDPRDPARVVDRDGLQAGEVKEGLWSIHQLARRL